jgi:hypothetical protein
VAGGASAGEPHDVNDTEATTTSAPLHILVNMPE